MWFAVNDPVFLHELIKCCIKTVFDSVQCPRFVLLAQCADHGASEMFGEGVDREQVVAVGAMPGLGCFIPGTTGDQAVQVNVLTQCLSPGVEYGYHA